MKTRLTKTQLDNVEHVTRGTRPDLNWRREPYFVPVVEELIQADAFRVLSKTSTDFLLFILSLRRYPKRKKKGSAQFDYWTPLNGHELLIPYKKVKDFFDQPNGMKKNAPAESTITRCIKELMRVGFFSQVKQGGHGHGVMSVYRLEHNWRVWKEGDPPCFTREGMSRQKGFCVPEAGVFNPSRNAVKN